MCCGVKKKQISIGDLANYKYGNMPTLRHSTQTYVHESGMLADWRASSEFPTLEGTLVSAPTLTPRAEPNQIQQHERASNVRLILSAWRAVCSPVGFARGSRPSGDGGSVRRQPRGRSRLAAPAPRRKVLLRKALWKTALGPFLTI